MSRGEREVEETLPASERAAAKRGGDEPTRPLSISRPRRYGLASRMERAQVLAALFDEPVEEVRVGRFVLSEYVGGGGMGEVYAAWDERAHRKVALKMVRADHAAAAQPNDRLLREAQVLAQLSDPNVVHLYEVDEIDGRVFLAMELVNGRSLRHWLNGPDAPSGRVRVREVLRRFVDAGRGLKAAHAAGLVHRDFKPDNVLVGDDGRVRVVDFGLARPVTDLVPAEAPGRPVSAGEIWSDGETLPSDGSGGRDSDRGRRPRPRRSGHVKTTHGRIMGTPPYMSPEQIRGAEADHRSDQFSFCVALYEALYGELPFAGASFSARLQAIERGVPEPPRGSTVPAPVRKAIERGLAADPADRFPDMGALLEVLERWLQPLWLVRLAVAAALGAAVAGGIALVLILSKNPCSDAGADLWKARRGAIHQAFIGTGLSYADATFRTLERVLGPYAKHLEEDVVSSCEATRVQETQSEELMGLRTLCLESRRRRLDALLEQFEHADASVVERAVLAAAELPDLATCRDASILLHAMQQPAPEIKGPADEIRNHLAQARTKQLLGKRDEALRIAREQLARAEALSYAPVEAEALYHIGRVLAYDGTPDERNEGEAVLRKAAKLAEIERQDALVAEIWNFLGLGACRNHSDTEQARQWHERADTAILRIGDPPLYRAAALRNLGCIHFHAREFAEAEGERRRALAKLESTPDASRLDQAAYLLDLAVVVRQQNRHQEAQTLYDRSLELHIKELGATHPRVANVRYGLAMLHKERGASAVARQRLEDLLLIHGETLGANHAVLGLTHLALGEISLQGGALSRAHEHASQAFDIYEHLYGAGHTRLADAYVLLGTIEFRRGAHEKALSIYETALGIDSRHLGATHSRVGFLHLNIAEAKLALRHHDEALAAVERAEPILQPRLADTPFLAPVLASVRGRVHLDKGDLDAAVPALERAVQGFQALPGDIMLMDRADAGWALVQALSKLGRANDPRALELARGALAIYERLGTEVHTPKREVQRWLDAHGGR